jgi:hypothetical protein
MSVQRFNKAQSETQPFHIYYDMNIINNDSSFPAQPVRFQYKETRSNYFLLSPQDYFMSIVRFNLQTPTLPVFIPQINLNTNTNKGGSFPIQSMQGNFAVGGIVNLYTSTVIPVGSVLYFALSDGAATSIHETSATNNQYYRVTASVLSPSTVNQTQLTVLNPTATGTASAYAGGTVAVTSATSPPVANQIAGGTITATFASLAITTMTFANSQLTITFTPITNLADLTNVFSVGDVIYISNSGTYNGSYAIQSFANTGQTVVLAATSLQGVVLPTYAGGGSFTSAGDFYNVTPYTMTMSYTTGNVPYQKTSPVIYVPNDLTQTPPQWNPSKAQALSLADVTSAYYWVYNYEVFINMVNQALVNTFWQLNGALYSNTGGHLPMSSTANSLAYQPPSMSWNQQALTGILTADNNAFGQSAGTFIKLSFNQPMSTLFDSFPYQYPNVSPDSPLYSYLVFNTSAGAGLYVVSSYTALGVPSAQYTAIQIYQDHQTATLMNPIQSIVFTSTILPVQMENVGTPLILNGSSQNQINIGSTANVFPIVTDFTVPFSATSGYVPDVSYVPSGEYRLVDMYGTSPANQADIQVFWKDQYGLIHPFLLGSGCSGSLKILFRRKDYNDVNLDE